MVEDQPEDNPVVEGQPGDNPMVEDQPEDNPMVEDQPEGNPMVEDQPEDNPMVEDQPEDGPMVEDQPEDGPTVGDQLGPVVGGEPGPVVEGQPEDSPTVEGQPEDNPVVDHRLLLTFVAATLFYITVARIHRLVADLVVHVAECFFACYHLLFNTLGHFSISLTSFPSLCYCTPLCAVKKTQRVVGKLRPSMVLRIQPAPDPDPNIG